jgi:SAM-dependent methyltransferase
VDINGTPVNDERLLSCLAEKPPNIGVLWEICAYFEWSDRAETVDNITSWLGPSDGLKVLDCACGSGFPAIDLAFRGYDVTCSDGSPLMLEHFRRNALREGVGIQPAQVRWEELSAHHGEAAFDVVMCRGCSLLYAGTWDDDQPPDRTLLTGAIQEFVACIRPGGRLYVDTSSAESLRAREPQWTRRPRFTVGTHSVELREVVTNDPDRGIRIWQSWLDIDGVTYEFERRSHYLPHDQLVDLLAGAGLVDIQQEQMKSEHYQVFTGKRPA